MQALLGGRPTCVLWIMQSATHPCCKRRCEYAPQSGSKSGNLEIEQLEASLPHFPNVEWWISIQPHSPCGEFGRFLMKVGGVFGRSVTVSYLCIFHFSWAFPVSFSRKALIWDHFLSSFPPVWCQNASFCHSFWLKCLCWPLDWCVNAVLRSSYKPSTVTLTQRTR